MNNEMQAQCWPETICEAIEDSGKGIIVVDSQRTVIQINQQASLWTGLKSGMTVGNIDGETIIEAQNHDLIKIKCGKSTEGSTVYFLSKRRTYDGLSDNKIVEYEKLVESLYDDYLLTDKDGTILVVRGISETSWGIGGNKVVGKKISDISSRDYTFPPSIMKAMSSGEKEVSLFNSSSNRSFIATSIPIFDETGDISRVVTVSQDVSEMDVLWSRLSNTQELMEFYRARIFEMYQNNPAKNSFIGSSAEIQNVSSLIIKAASVDSNILILGESGVGKDLIARKIHELSSRKDHAFVKINCGAIPDALLESELFGYEKGAFTGAANQGRDGLIMMADQGTLFLDEIGDMPLHLQVKILELIQDRIFKRVGGNNQISVDVRIIAATNVNLEKMVNDKRFRLDLFYRLNVFPIKVPPLREHREDVGELCHHFIRHYNTVFNKNIGISPEAIECLEQHDWPGNVRQLANVIERLMILTEKSEIGVDDIAREVCSQMQRVTLDEPIHLNRLIPWKEAVELLGNLLFGAAYKQYHSTVKVAKVLGVNQSTVVRQLQKIPRAE